MQDAAGTRHNFLVALNFAAIYTLWGSTYLAIRFGLDDLPPALMAGTRFLIAGIVLLAWLLWRRVPLPPRSPGMAAVSVANLPFFVAAIEAARRDGERLRPTCAGPADRSTPVDASAG